jgi:hypothetical protein
VGLLFGVMAKEHNYQAECLSIQAPDRHCNGYPAQASEAQKINEWKKAA